MQGITKKDLAKFAKEYDKNPINKVMANVLANNQLTSSIRLTEPRVYNQYNFEIDIKTMSVCNQKSSGRCWVFAGLNVLREIVAKKFNIKEFELSQNFFAFYDKLEKINYKLESVIELCDRDWDDRTLSHVLGEGIQDGGQWDMLVNIIKKYGLVPKHAMDETFQSSNTRETNYVIANTIRKFAAVSSKLVKAGKMDEIRKLKDETLSKLYAVLCMAYGKPVEVFDFEYVDKDDKYHLDQGLTPLSFYEKYVGTSLDDYVSIINSPTKDKPFYNLFTVNYVGNVVDGRKITYINLPIEEMKELCLKQLKAGELIWFGSDCGKYGNRETGVWDDKSYDYLNTLGIDMHMDKADMLDYHVSSMDHAMVITGVSFKDGKVGKWKIENSWGPTAGNNGYYMMTDSWFDQFVYQAVINKKHLSKKQLDVLKKKPIELNPWDPMGTLAD